MNAPLSSRFALPTRKGPTQRLLAATGIHRGDRQYQQDQVAVFVHPHNARCLLGVVADGMGGKSGGRKAADQVLLTAQQLFERFAPESEDPAEMLRLLCAEAHLMIKLTALSAEEEPHSTLATFLVMPDLRCYWLHTGDSRIYWMRNGEFKQRSFDQSYVQRLVDEGQISEADAQTHPQSNLLTACLGTQQDPTPVQAEIGRLETGDTLMVCSDGLWHYFNNRELATVLCSLSPRESAELLINKARQRANGGGDNLSLAVVRLVEAD